CSIPACCGWRSRTTMRRRPRWQPLINISTVIHTIETARSNALLRAGHQKINGLTALGRQIREGILYCRGHAATRLLGSASDRCKRTTRAARSCTYGEKSRSSQQAYSDNSKDAAQVIIDSKLLSVCDHSGALFALLIL